ncbi:hypothetical protein H0E87_014931 [Populus deltoides]|uniref:HAT C-terminal dimerisation domain-containing protein n=1 Tax=Populus deltoides TaxID=3696 RepID=A0A8T2YFC4_POPDE|nr:hypothetical protein H0E87_014931 [Populus deltoides]
MTAGEVSINIHDHGAALDEKKKRVQCNYCGKVLSGFSRLKYHVGGIRGDVVPCEKVAENVRESLRSMLLETKRASRDNEVQNLYHPDLPWKRYCSPDLNAAKRKKRDANQTTGCGSGMHAEMHSVVEDDMTEHVSVNNRRRAMSSGPKENVMSRQAQRCVGRFFYETGFDFSASTLPSFQRMINATLDDGHSEYKVPSLQDLKGWILHDEGMRVAHLVGDHSFWSGAEMASKATVPLDPEVTFGLLCCVVRMVADQRTQLKITFQLDEYRHARGAFQEGKAIVKRTNISPAQWWCTYGKQCPELQRFAVRILSQTCDGASRYGLKRSMAEKLLTDRRNPLEQQRLRDLTFVHYNLQVQNKRSGFRSDVICEEIDPMDDWVVDEAPQEVVPENGDRGLMDSEGSEAEGHCGIQAKEEPIEDA